MNAHVVVKKLLCILFFIVCCIQQTQAISSPASPPQEHDALEHLLRQDMAHMRTIDRILEDLLLLVSGRTIMTSNKRETIAHIQELKQCINELIHEPFITIDAATLFHLSCLSTAIIKHITAALDNHLAAFPAFDFETVDMRRAVKHVSVEELSHLLVNNKKMLNNLASKAKSAGLRWYNKTYRTFDTAILQPCSAYSIHTRAGKGLLAGIFATYIAYLSDAQLPWLRDGLFGLGWHFKTENGSNSLNTTYHTRRPLKWLGSFEYYLWEKTQGMLPIGLLLWGMLQPALQIEASTVHSLCKKKLLKLHNFLKGGTYSEKPEQPFLVNPKVTFKDLVGLEHAQETLSFIVRYLEDPEQFDRAQLTPEKGYLLTGPTRTGKSYLAEALCGEIKAMFKRTKKNPKAFNFYSLSASFVLGSVNEI